MQLCPLPSLEQRNLRVQTIKLGSVRAGQLLAGRDLQAPAICDEVHQLRQGRTSWLESMAARQRRTFASSGMRLLEKS